MAPFPGQGYFSAGYPVYMGTMPELAAGCASAFRSSWRSTSAGYSAQVSYGGAIVVLSKWLAARGGRTSAPAAQQVINTRPYDWYVSQNDTDRYAAVNCMPAITAMALRWYSPELIFSPGQLRGRYPEITTGWRMSQVTDTLKALSVPYKQHTLTLNEVLRQLDLGKIILVQISEGDPQEVAHCMVIFGYRQRGSTLEVLVHDPASSAEPGLYSRPPLSSMWLQAEYVLFISQRITGSFISVSPQAP